MNNCLIPDNVQEKIVDLGFHPISFIPLYKGWSVVGIIDEQRYNIQLKTDLSVSSIHQLKYRWNASGAKILGVTRVLIEENA